MCSFMYGSIFNIMVNAMFCIMYGFKFHGMFGTVKSFMLSNIFSCILTRMVLCLVLFLITWSLLCKVFGFSKKLNRVSKHHRRVMRRWSDVTLIRCDCAMSCTSDYKCWWLEGAMFCWRPRRYNRLNVSVPLFILHWIRFMR